MSTIIKAKSRIFIGCEGDSERAYSMWIQAIANNLSIPITIDAPVAGGGDPLSIFEKSLRYFKQGQKLRGKYKHKCVLLDKDKIGKSPERDKKLYQMSRDEDFPLLFQEWEHEALLLRHFPGCHTLRPPAGKGLAALKKQWPNYEKPASSADLKKNIDVFCLKQACLTEFQLRTFLNKIGFSMGS